MLGSISTGVYKSFPLQFISHKYTLNSSEEIKLFGLPLFNDNELISPELLLLQNFTLVFDLISFFDEENFGIFEFVSNVGIVSSYILSNLITLYPAVNISSFLLFDEGKICNPFISSEYYKLL